MAFSNQWACSACTYNNHESLNKCEICGTKNPSAKVDDNSSNGWKCVRCTLENDFNLSACSVCGAPSPIHNDLAGKQICASCTSINPANATSCAVCLQPMNPSIIQKDDDGDLVMKQLDKPIPPPNIPMNNGYDNNFHYPQPPIPQPIKPVQPHQPINGYNAPSFFSGMNSFFGQNNGYNDNYNNNMVSKPRKKVKQQKNKSSDIQFKDVSEIFAEDVNDEDRIREEIEAVKVLSEMYAHIYLTKKAQFDKNKICQILHKMIKFIPKEHWEEVKEQNEDKCEQKDNYNECQVCFCEFDQNEGKLIEMKQYCQHAMICKSCFVQNLKIKIKDDDITPWILCAAQDCKAPICCDLLLQFLDLSHLYTFAKAFIRKHLARNKHWIRCKTEKCEFGWMILDKNEDKVHKLKCQSCKKKHSVCKNPIKSDDGFNELIKNGTLRLCPKCSLPTMKDKGMCNVMHCGKCGIFWNWKTKETGTSSAQLKNRARMNGTLWEPGELAYQQKLQRTNLAEFKKLLERNGIKYNPNYVRGS